MEYQIVVPMAGEGQRFRDAGFSVPKPLIPVGNVPMVVRVIRDLPAACRVIFLARSAHLENYPLEEELKREVPDAVVVPVRELTEGQACTVRLAADSLLSDCPVIVAACDNTHLYNLELHDRLMAPGGPECLVWTYRNDSRVLPNPNQFGWVVEEDGDVIRVSCKEPVSRRPIADHALSGFFTFRSPAIMIEGIDALVRSDERINGEFYMDVVPNLLIAQGHRVSVFEVEKYVGWGTPQDLRDYNLWAEYFGRTESGG